MKHLSNSSRFTEGLAPSGTQQPESGAGHENSPKPVLILALFVVTLFTVAYLVFDPWGKPELTPERSAKRNREIEGIKAKPRKEGPCEVYALLARNNGWYPCYSCADSVKIYLIRGEVWKYGKTCIGKEKRYSQDYLDGLLLDFYHIARGTEADCLIIEKELIYAYPTLPECIKRAFFMIRPPGHKMDK